MGYNGPGSAAPPSVGGGMPPYATATPPIPGGGGQLPSTKPPEVNMLTWNESLKYVTVRFSYVLILKQDKSIIYHI